MPFPVIWTPIIWLIFFPAFGWIYRFKRKFKKYFGERKNPKKFIWIWEDVSLSLINLERLGWLLTTILLILTMGLIEKNGATEKGGVDFEKKDWSISIHLHWGLKKILCRTCQLFCAFKCSVHLFFHPVITEIFWWLGIVQNREKDLH